MLDKLARRAWVVALWNISACGSTEAPSAQPWSATPAQSVQPAAASPGSPAANSNSAAAAAVSSAAAPAQPSASAAAAMTMAMAMTGATAGAAAPASQTTPPPNAATDPKPAADGCQERRVSYAKPCTSDPDPCKIASGWTGDEYCLLPPSTEQGLQIHIGPKNYKDMAEVAKYVIQPGEEFNNSVIAHIPLTTDKVWWNRINVHMRPGSHHWISSVVSGKPEEKFYSDTSCGASQIGSLGGGQNLIYDNPPGGVPAPENEGLGRELPGDSSLCMNLHAYNFTDKPQLREIWINLHTVPESEVTQKASGIGMVGGLGLNLGPKQKKEATYQGTFMQDGRIIQLFGHRHVWTPRFATWLNDRLIYDSWSWEESATFNYDSLTMNPPIMTEQKKDGAVSGTVPVKAGDVLKFTCFIDNTSDKTLGFSNELYDGEMCNLWGSAVGTSLGGTFL